MTSPVVQPQNLDIFVPPRILFLAGSARKESIHKMLTKAGARTAEAASAAATRIGNEAPSLSSKVGRQLHDPGVSIAQADH
jgi:NAD(P)H-dependent FMN reductase